MTPRFFVCACAWALAMSACAATPSKQDPPVDLSGFGDIIKHWDDQKAEKDQALYEPDDVRAIADNILLYQRNNGGWPTNKHPLRVLTEAERQAVLANKAKRDTSFDNRNTYPQIEYLAAAYKHTGDQRYLEASRKGLTFVLEQQLDNGGFTHSPPSTEGYYGHITFADEVMPGVLGLLRRVAKGEAPFDIYGQPLRQRAAEALAKGDELLLRLQIRQSGIRTVWAGQYDQDTLEPVQGRAYEFPALQSWESVAVVRYLMSIDEPSREVIDAVEGAVQWFRAVQLGGMKLEKVEAPDQRFNYHTSTHDLRVVADPTAPPIWARFYELDTNQPFLANRDGTKVYRLADVKRERRSGYSWYGYWPQALVEEDYPRWRRRLSR